MSDPNTFIDDAWLWMMSEIDLGHEAAGVLFDDLRTLRPRPIYDSAVEAAVTFKPSPDEDRTATAVLPLADVWRLELDGAFVVDVRAPSPPPIALLALGRAELVARRGLIALADHRGIGTLALSDVPYGKGTVGAHVTNWSERSGVPQVNERREAAVHELRQQHAKHPREFKRKLVHGIVATEIISYWRELPCGPGFSWMVYEDDGTEIVEFDTETIKLKRVADRIVDALSVEAYGATRPDLRSAQAWETGWNDDPPRDATGEIISEPGRETYPGARDDLGRKVDFDQWANQHEQRNNSLIGNFNLMHLGPDFVGDLAAELTDGTGGLAQFWALYSSWYEELVDYWGLAPREAKMLVDSVTKRLSVGEIGHLCGIDPRIVAQILKRARQKCTRPPLAPEIHPSITRAIEAAKDHGDDFVTVL